MHSVSRMPYARPTSIGFFNAAWLSLLLLFSPSKFIEAQNRDNEQLKITNAGKDKEPSVFAVRRAFFVSLRLVLLSGIFGFGCGFLLGNLLIYVSPKVVVWLQIIGACLLLWGTLFVRGWEVQTYGGLTLTERVNHWIYRFLYCVGTAVIVSSLALP